LGKKAITFLFKIIFYVAQGKKESHRDLERHECEYMMTEFSFL